MRRYLAVTLAAALLLVACKSTSSNPAVKGASVTTTPITDTRAPGVTSNSIKVGIVYINLKPLESVIHLNQGDFAKAYQAIVDDINAHGGIHGRKLDATLVSINPASPTDAQAACTKLTQDDKVFVAVGFFLADNVLCYVGTNQTATIGGAITPDRLAQAKAPWYSTDAGENLEIAVVKAMAQAGKFDGKLAVLAESADQQLMKDKILPELKAAGITPVQTAIMSAPTSDATATMAEAQTISERFKAEGVQKLLLVGESAPGAYLQGLAKTTFRPQVIVTDENGLAAFTGSKTNDLSVLDNALSGGPFGPPDARLALGGPTKACMDIQRNAGLIIKPSSTVPSGQPDQFVSSALACQQMVLLEAILQKAGPTLNYGTFAAAGNSLGKIVLPTFPDPWTFGAPPNADGNPKVYFFKWDSSTDQFEITK